MSTPTRLYYWAKDPDWSNPKFESVQKRTKGIWGMLQQRYKDGHATRVTVARWWDLPPRAVGAEITFFVASAFRAPSPLGSTCKSFYRDIPTRNTRYNDERSLVFVS